MDYYRKQLSYIEAERHFIYISRRVKNMFPKKGQTFTLLIGDNEFKASVDNYGRLWANSNLIKKYIEFKPHKVFIFTKKDNKLRLACEH